MIRNRRKIFKSYTKYPNVCFFSVSASSSIKDHPTDLTSPLKKRRYHNSYTSQDNGSTPLSTTSGNSSSSSKYHKTPREQLGDCVAQRTRSKTVSPDEPTTSSGGLSSSANNYRRSAYGKSLADLQSCIDTTTPQRLTAKTKGSSGASGSSKSSKSNLLNYYRKTRKISHSRPKRTPTQQQESATTFYLAGAKVTAAAGYFKTITFFDEESSDNSGSEAEPQESSSSSIGKQTKAIASGSEEKYKFKSSIGSSRHKRNYRNQNNTTTAGTSETAITTSSLSTRNNTRQLTECVGDKKQQQHNNNKNFLSIVGNKAKLNIKTTPSGSAPSPATAVAATETAASTSSSFLAGSGGATNSLSAAGVDQQTTSPTGLHLDKISKYRKNLRNYQTFLNNLTHELNNTQQEISESVGDTLPPQQAATSNHATAVEQPDLNTSAYSNSDNEFLAALAASSTEDDSEDIIEEEDEDNDEEEEEEEEDIEVDLINAAEEIELFDDEEDDEDIEDEQDIDDEEIEEEEEDIADEINDSVAAFEGKSVTDTPNTPIISRYNSYNLQSPSPFGADDKVYTLVCSLVPHCLRKNNHKLFSIYKNFL